MKTIPLLTILLIFHLSIVTPVSAVCNVCKNCTNCAPDALADNYLNDIDALLQGKVQQLGYITGISRNQTSASITYQLQYSSGLSIALQLSLSTMQIQLISYVMNNNMIQSQSTVTTTTTTSYSKTSDGYYIINDLSANSNVTQMMSFLQSVVKSNFSNFQLIGAEFINTTSVVYRLKFKILSVSSTSISIIEEIYIQIIGSDTFKLIDANYTSNSGRLSPVNLNLISTDQWLIQINSLLLKNYNNYLGNNPILIKLAENIPYYQLVYSNGDNNYSFIILYDFILNRIV